MFGILGDPGADEEDDEIAVDVGSPPAGVDFHDRQYHTAHPGLQLASAMVMSPPPLSTLIVLWDSALVGTDTLSSPPSALLLTR